MSALAPIVIFTYKRLDTLQHTIDTLKQCDLIDESEVIIFSDGPKGEHDFEQVATIRQYLKQLTCFKSITLHFSETNKALANSIIDGVTAVINKNGKVIVLEDDLQLSKNFLVYMNQALEKYENVADVFSISGYNIPIKLPYQYKYDVYFTPRASSWGWATWIDRWEEIDWKVSDYTDFRTNKKMVKEFNNGGSDLAGMLKRQMEGKINSWAIRWCYHQFKVKKFTAYPVISKIQNIGFSDQATNSNVYNRYKTNLDNSNKRNFIFPDKVELQPYLQNQFRKFYSIVTRAFYLIKTLFYKAHI